MGNLLANIAKGIIGKFSIKAEQLRFFVGDQKC